MPWGGGVGFTGGVAGAGENINTSAPAGGGWEGRFNNSGTRPDATFRVDAICARQPAGYTTTFTTVDNPPGAQSAAVAVCPAGTRLLSGGTLSTADTVDVQLLSAWPLGPDRPGRSYGGLRPGLGDQGLPHRQRGPARPGRAAACRAAAARQGLHETARSPASWGCVRMVDSHVVAAVLGTASRREAATRAAELGVLDAQDR